MKHKLTLKNGLLITASLLFAIQIGGCFDDDDVTTTTTTTTTCYDDMLMVSPLINRPP